MRFATIFILTILTINANLIPQKSYGSVEEVTSSNIKVSNLIAKDGMSAAVVRSFPNGKELIVSYIMKKGSRVVVIDKDPLDGRGLARPKALVKVGDKVISGFLYDKVMILANNKENFYNIQSQFGIDSLNPDNFMAFLAAKGKSSYNYSDLREFGKLVGIGVFVVQKGNRLEVVDAISKKVINSANFNSSNKAKIKPFYNSFSN